MVKVKELFRFYTTFKGRVTRKQYILYATLPSWITALVMYELDHWLSVTRQQYFDFLSLGNILFWLIPALSVAVRRLHDMNFSGWWTALIGPILIFLSLGSVVGYYFMHPVLLQEILKPDFVSQPASVRWTLYAVMLPVGFVDLAIYAVKRGTKGPNKYGQDPLEGIPYVA